MLQDLADVSIRDQRQVRIVCRLELPFRDHIP
jgi:hypothetical protein